MRPWWPSNFTVEDPVDATLAGWLRPQRFVTWGVGLILVVFGSLVAWNLTADLERGAIGEGTVQSESYRKIVSSHYAALVQQINVRENQHVEAGEPLLVLDPTDSEVNTRILERKHWAEQTHIARLEAIRSGQEAITFPKDLLDFAAQDPEIAEAVGVARATFAASRNSTAERLAQFRSQQQQADQSLAGQRAQRAQLVAQQALFQKELDGVRSLLDQGLERKPKLLELQRNSAAVEGNIAAIDANIARIQMQRNELELRAQSLIADERDTASRQLTQAWDADLEYTDRLKAARNLMSLTVLRAPRSGTVLNVKVKTVGAVVRPDEALVEIVPDQDALMLRVIVPPQDISDVKPGTAARVSIHGGGRGLRRLNANVINVSPDLVPNPRSLAGTYIADVEIEPDALSADARKRLQPGMSATVKLITGHRSVWTYMTEGLLDALRGHQALMEGKDSAARKPE
ncbi:alkaline protease secretion protein AprE [Rhodospirillales bacterium TMPK1]|uniref:Membrane fusion protein (MFP) family protein n=1 Tax=Roseiterribacter gracilis TaxID=2812848 RepID=A0A8S8XHE0_9PROT|nr:alkaline protease secretion protein AprE [Rhodospirillales bacterium TMPK1]